MFGIGTWEIVCILLFALMFYGPEQLPDIAKKVAYALKHFKKMSHEVKTVIQKEFSQMERETQLKEMKEHIEEMRNSSNQLAKDVKSELKSIEQTASDVLSSNDDESKYE